MHQLRREEVSVLLDTVTELAKLDPWEPDPGCGCCAEGDYHCYFCGVENYGHPSDVLARHTPDCLWRRAREAVS